MSLDRSIQSFSIARPLPPSAGVALSVFRSGTDDIISTNDFGTSLGSISQSEGFGMLSFGINLGSLSGGFNIKAYFNNLDNYSGNGIGFDFGFLYNLNDIKSEFPILNDKKLVYLDSAASAQKPSFVINAIDDTYSNHYANIHRGLYTLSQIATDKHEDAREIVKEFINAESSKEIIFFKKILIYFNLLTAL